MTTGTSTETVFPEGDLKLLESLSRTLEKVAVSGADAVYTGTIADDIIKTVSRSVYFQLQKISEINKLVINQAAKFSFVLHAKSVLLTQTQGWFHKVSRIE